jgi:hypothetical protein
MCPAAGFGTDMFSSLKRASERGKYNTKTVDSAEKMDYREIG